MVEETYENVEWVGCGPIPGENELRCRFHTDDGYIGEAIVEEVDEFTDVEDVHVVRDSMAITGAFSTSFEEPVTCTVSETRTDYGDWNTVMCQTNRGN
jgi:hypothetical protein